MSDPRRDPDDEQRSVVTGVRRATVLKRLAALAPLPSLPPVEARTDPNCVLEFMRQIAQVHRDDAAYVQARAEESREELKAELDQVNARVIVLDGKLGRLEERVNTVVNAQIVQGSQITELQKALDKTERTFTTAITNVHARIDDVIDRVSNAHGRLDSFEKTFAQFREMILSDIDVRRRQLELDEARNGTTSSLPHDAPGDACGPPTTRPRGK